jgi:hypothetical protein
MTLLLPIRQASEGAPQYLARIVVANGFASASELASSVGLDFTAVSQGRELSTFAEVFAMPVDQLSAATATVAKDGIHISGQRLRPRQWSTRSVPRICCACWSEDLVGDRFYQRLPRNWQRTVWDIQPLTVCTTHNALLASQCACGRPLSRSNWLSNACECGSSYSSLPVVEIDPQAGRGDRHVIERLEGEIDGTGPISDLDLGDTITVLQVLGRTAAAIPDNGVPRHVVLSSGLDIWREWPNAFDEALEELRSSRLGEGEWGASKAYGRLVEDVRQLRLPAVQELIASRIAHHASVTGVSRALKSIAGVPAPVPGAITLHRFARDLSIGFTRARRIADTSRVNDGKLRRGFPARIPIAEAARLKQELAAEIDAKTLGRDLGLGKAAVRSLVDTGLVRRTSNGRFDRESAKSLRWRLIWPAMARFPDTPITLRSASKKLQMPISEVCRAVHDRSLSAIGFARGRAVVDQVVIDLDEARRTLRKHEKGLLTVEQAAARLGVKWEVASKLSKAGFLGRLVGERLETSGVEAFQSCHIKNSDLALELKTSPRALLDRARSIGIDPSIAPPECRQVFFPRSVAPRLRTSH